MLAADGRHQLLADADAEERGAARDHARLDRLEEAGDGGEAGAAVGEGADAGQDDALGREHDVGVGGDDDGSAAAGLGGHALEALLGRVQVAARVVDDRGGHPPSVPLVEGTPAGAGVGLDGFAQRAGDGLEAGLGDVVAVGAVEEGDVEGEAGVHRDGGEELADELGVEGADLRAREIDLPDEERPAGEVERGADEGFVHRQQAGAVAADAGLVTERPGERPAERDADVLDGVVVVDMQIAGGAGRRGRSSRGGRAGRACGRRSRRRWRCRAARCRRGRA